MMVITTIIVAGNGMDINNLLFAGSCRSIRKD